VACHNTSYFDFLHLICLQKSNSFLTVVEKIVFVFRGKIRVCWRIRMSFWSRPDGLD
jgi:hypothetical protein